MWVYLKEWGSTKKKKVKVENEGDSDGDSTETPLEHEDMAKKSIKGVEKGRDRNREEDEE